VQTCKNRFFPEGGGGEKKSGNTDRYRCAFFPSIREVRDDHPRRLQNIARDHVYDHNEALSIRFCHLFVQVADQQDARLSGHLTGESERAGRERATGQSEPERHARHGRVGERRGQRRRQSVDGVERRGQHTRATCKAEKTNVKTGLRINCTLML